MKTRDGGGGEVEGVNVYVCLFVFIDACRVPLALCVCWLRYMLILNHTHSPSIIHTTENLCNLCRKNHNSIRFYHNVVGDKQLTKSSYKQNIISFASVLQNIFRDGLGYQLVISKTTKEALIRPLRDVLEERLPSWSPQAPCLMAWCKKSWDLCSRDRPLLVNQRYMTKSL